MTEPSTRALPPLWPIEQFAWQHEREAASMLVRAFFHDPLVQAICGEPSSKRTEKMWWSFRLSLRAHCLSRHPAWIVRGSAGAICGLISVSFPGGAVTAASDTLFSLRSLWHIGWSAAQRAVEAARTIARHMPRPPFLYVRTLGVDPAVQHRGLGSRLLTHALQATEHPLPAYLETAREENLHFYSRHGFRCLGTFFAVGVPIWRLWRPAAA
ncbi:MAG: GNAT family N-acetyltransferase [Candidatus Binatia bacterium]|nr:GNAT family N-acetyltransferase [Candidatus Binatia bacterium]